VNRFPRITQVLIVIVVALALGLGASPANKPADTTTQTVVRVIP
jgi:hypothetical protein